MTRLHILYALTVLLILIPVIVALVKYGNTPITDMPVWVYFLIGNK